MLAVVCLAPAPALAQLVIDPTRVEFNPSPDHDAVNGDTPMVWSYQFELYLVGDTSPFQVIDLGKPGVDPDGVIRIDLISVLNPLPPSGNELVARVAAVGPGGITRSALSNPFAWSDSSPSPPPIPEPPPPPSEPPPSEPPPSELPVPAPVLCSFSISPLFQLAGADAATLTVSVFTDNDCSWTAEEDLDWVSIDVDAISTGSGDVTYSLNANPGTTSRSGTLLIAGETLWITQSADNPCSYSLSRSAQSFSALAGTATVTVTAGAGCSWTVTDNSSWITISSGASGTGTGTVTYAVTTNTGTSARSGTLTIGGVVLSVTQEGTPTVPPPPGNLRFE